MFRRARPSDLEQREGRIIRQGNTDQKVKIFRYVTEGTFDSYLWQIIEQKQRFIGQIMTSKSPVRSCEDVDEAALNYAEVKALATGNPYIKEKMDLDIQVSKLKLMKANHTSQKYQLEDNIAKNYPHQIQTIKERIEGLRADIGTYNAKKSESFSMVEGTEEKAPFSMTVAGKVFDDRKDAGSAIIDICKEMKTADVQVPIGEYMGMKMTASFDPFFRKFNVTLKGQLSHTVEVGSDPSGNITRINNALENMTKQMEESVAKLENVQKQLETAKIEVTKPFAHEQELSDKLQRLAELNSLLDMDENGDDAVSVEAGDAIDRAGDTNREESSTASPVVDIPVTDNAREFVNVAERPALGYAVREGGTAYHAGKPSIRQKLNAFQEKVKNGEVKETVARQKAVMPPEK